MRSIVLTILIFGMLPTIFWRPYYGALIWAWVSMMNPHRLTYGFAFNFPFAAIIAAVTLLALMLSKERKEFPPGPIPVLLIVFVLWMCVTSIFAVASWNETYPMWNRVMKIHLMLMVTFVLIRTYEQIQQLIWVMVISIGFYGVKGGIWTVLTGGGGTVWGPPGGVIQAINELALALVILAPLMYYLSSIARKRYVKWGLIFAMLCCGFSILGSHSRGAFLAVIAAVATLAWKSNKKFMIGTLGAIALAGMVAFMPANWTQRMHTIENYEQDGSAMSRLTTWRTLWNMALDRPIVGAGFETGIVEVYERYAPPDVRWGLFAPHSIYFQALGEHGFVGLGIFLTLLAVAWRRATYVARLCRSTPGFESGDLLMRMVQTSLMGFMVGGTFLGLLHFDFPYYMIGLVVMLEGAVKNHLKSPASAPDPAARPAPSARPTGDDAFARTGHPRPAEGPAPYARNAALGKRPGFIGRGPP